MKHLLWVDCTAGALAGLVVIALSGWLAPLEGIPRNVLLFTGAVNVLYGTFSFSLAVRPVRPMRLIKALVFANLAWAPVCVTILVLYAPTATPFAYLHLAGEALFVAGLALLEWRHRDLLLER
ncbi:MAG: hypothetical protein AAF752_13895 [Bacteroidota bacterium]